MIARHIINPTIKWSLVGPITILWKNQGLPTPFRKIKVTFDNWTKPISQLLLFCFVCMCTMLSTVEVQLGGQEALFPSILSVVRTENLIAEITCSYYLVARLH
jgi:hypothetical protein